MSRWILVLSALVGAALRLNAATAADKSFDSAYKLLQDTAYGRAEEEFGKLVVTYTNWARLPQAILFQAVARFHQTNYAGAIDLLTTPSGAAGKWADEYLFWLAKACSQKGDDRAASTNYAKLVQQFPSSSRCLEAAVGQATAFSNLRQWQQAVDLLQQTNGIFQNALRTNSSSELILHGQILLGEALLAQQHYSAAETSLQPMAKLPLPPEVDWQRQYLLCRIQWADHRPQQALDGTTNLLPLAAKAANRRLQVESAAFRGDLLELVGQPSEAIAAYNANLSEGVSSKYQRQAILQITKLSLMQNRFAEAAAMLEQFLSRFPGAPDGDAALLGLAEIRLQQHWSGLCTNVAPVSATNAPGATNCVEQALLKLRDLKAKFPQSALLGKRFLDLGWCFWEQGKMAEAQTNFQAAVEQLPPSADQALARFKLGDTLFQQKDFARALTNYNLLIAKFGASEEVKTNLLESALYQCVQAAAAMHDLPSATNAMARLLASFPTDFHTERAVLLTGQQMRKEGHPAAARDIFSSFARLAADAPLLPQMQLVVARTYEDQNQWTNSIAQYDRWLTTFTNHPARPQAEFFRARAALLAGQETNALALLTDFIARYPADELAPLARFLAADHYFHAGKFSEAEINYQLVFQNTNWPVSELTYQAMMMAGRAAVEQQGWSGARDYFLKLYQAAA